MIQWFNGTMVQLIIGKFCCGLNEFAVIKNIFYFYFMNLNGDKNKMFRNR